MLIALYIYIIEYQTFVNMGQKALTKIYTYLLVQVKSWFANKRNRTNNTKPKVQKKALQERLLNVSYFYYTIMICSTVIIFVSKIRDFFVYS